MPVTGTHQTLLVREKYEDLMMHRSVLYKTYKPTVFRRQTNREVFFLLLFLFCFFLLLKSKHVMSELAAKPPSKEYRTFVPRLRLKFKNSPKIHSDSRLTDSSIQCYRVSTVHDFDRIYQILEFCMFSFRMEAIYLKSKTNL